MRFTFLSICISLLFFSNALAQPQNREKLLRNLLDLPAPAPGKTDGETASVATERPREFYRWQNMPPDDAPIEDLLEYWKRQIYQPSQIMYRGPMSATTAERLLDHLKDNPSLLTDYLGGFPTDERTANRLRDIYRSQKTDDASVNRLSPLKEWLTNNTSDGIPDLSKLVRKIRDRSDYVSNEYQVALKSLAKLDWDAARPHVERLEFDGSNPHSQILAYWTKYSHALAENDSSGVETYRRKLQQIVEDRSARWSQRDLAMDALVDGGNWDGRDAWYISLFSDETLLEIQDNGYTGMTTLMNASATTDEWIDRFLSLVKSGNKAARSAAARNLMTIYDDEDRILEALLPWVADPNWAKESRDSERAKLIEALGEKDIPGSLPALMALLSNEADDQWSEAAEALAKRKDPRTASTLRSLLTKTGGELREEIIEALIACGAVSADEQMADVEAYAVMSLTEEGRNAIESEANSDYDDEDDGEAPRAAKKPAIPIEVVIGKALADTDEPEEALAARSIERAKSLRAKNPALAARLTEIINGWSGRPVYLERVRRMSTGETDLDNIVGLLAERADVREKIPNELAALRSSGGVGRGIGACLSERDTEFLSVIADGDLESQVTVLGCARLLRAKLPVKDVARMLDSPNALLKHAAERYLESEDSLDARRIVLAKHPGEAKLLGAHSAFMPDQKKIASSGFLEELFKTVNSKSYPADLPNLRAFERSLQTEMKEDKSLVAIFAHLPESKSGQQVVRVYKDRSNYTFYEDPARSWSRNLTEKEITNFYNSIVSNKIDSLSPTLQGCFDGSCPSAELVLLGREGGRRVFFAGHPIGPEILAVNEQFESFRSKDDLKLRYRLAEKIKGLEVLLADKKFPVHAVWKHGPDLRFLISDMALAESLQRDLVEKLQSEFLAETDDEDEEAARDRRTKFFQRQQQLRAETIGKELSWRTLEKGTVGPVVEQPSDINLLPSLAQIPVNYRSQFFRSPRQIGTADTVYANRYQNGLFRAQAAGEPVLIKEGRYESPVASPDKLWAAATKFTTDDEKAIVRINLQSGREFRLNIANANGLYPIAYLPTHAKVLLYRGPETYRYVGIGMEAYEDLRDDVPAESGDSRSNVSPSNAEYYLLDLPTGAVRPVKGEFRPIEERSYRPLQKSSTPGGVWAAIYDRASKSTQVGLYLEKTFTFVPITTLPEIRLQSSDIWVSEEDKKIYFVYEGHLLAAPLAGL